MEIPALESHLKDIKKRFQYWRFPVKLATFLRTPFLTEYLR